MAENKLQIKTNVGDQVIARVNNLCDAGFNMPKDYNYVNAIKMSMLKLQDLKDKNGRSALEVCTPASIQTGLFQMCCKGLNAALNQIYFIVRGDQLCCQDSYFGKVLMVKRFYPDWNPNPVVIREGDIFEYAIDAKTGMKYIVKHEQKLENIDKGFIGGYMYLPTGELYIMTKKQIMTAWSKSSSREQATHKAFDEKMIGKTLVNSGCNMIINATPEYQMALDEETVEVENRLPSNDFTDFEEVDEASEPATTSVEPKPEVKEEEYKPKVVEEQPKVETPQSTTPNQEFEETDLDF